MSPLPPHPLAETRRILDGAEPSPRQALDAAVMFASELYQPFGEGAVAEVVAVITRSWATAYRQHGWDAVNPSGVAA
jgi:hypothetical protein